MKTKVLAFTTLFAMVLGAEAATVSQVLVRQQWPWSAKVRIDYSLVCETGESCDVDVTVKSEDGTVIPSLDNAFTGDRREVGTGDHVIWWDPVASGAADLPKVLKFEVTAANDPQRYIVIDISSTNACTLAYLAQPPAGGFNTDEYKTTKIVLKHVKPGSFIMGTPEDEWGRRTAISGNYVNDMPQHRVTLTQDFWMGLFPITFQQASIVHGSEFGKTGTYAANQKASSPASNVNVEDLIGWGGASDPSWYDSPVPREGSWLYALQANIVSGAIPEGTHFGLPTEAQWEYVCRAGTTTAFNNGTDSIDGVGPATPVSKPMYPVGGYNPNAWGFYDFHGCVWQWTIDSHGANIGTAAVTDPYAKTSKDDLWPTLRGGSYSTSSAVSGDVRSGSRYYKTCSGTSRDSLCGARIVIVRKP